MKDTREVEREPKIVNDNGSDSSSSNGSTVKSPIFGETNSALSPVVSQDGLKRRKPRNNIVKSNSSFVSRVIPHEALTKRLQEHNVNGVYAFANINRAL